PTHVPIAPKDSPSKYRPSSRAISVRTSPAVSRLRPNFQLCQRDTPTPHCLVMLSEAKHLWLFIPALQQKGCEILRLAQNDKSRWQKTRIEVSIRVFEILPRRCRSGGSPVPFQ